MKIRMSQEQKILRNIVIFIGLLVGILFVIAGMTRSEYQETYDLHQIKLQDEQITQQEEDGYPVAVIQARLDQDISGQTDIMMYVKYTDVRIFLNDDLIYENHMWEKNQPIYMRATEGWESMESVAATTGDTVRIELKAVYQNMSENVLKRFTSSLTEGKYPDLVKKVRNENRVELCFGYLVICCGFVLFLGALIFSLFRISYMIKGVASGLFVFFGGLWYLIEAGSDYWEMIISNDIIYNFLDVYIVFLMPVMISFYLSTYLKQRKRQKIAYLCITAEIIFDIVLLVLALRGVYHLFSVQWCVVFLILIAAVVLVQYIIEMRQEIKQIQIKQKIWKNQKLSVLVTFVPWCIGALLQYWDFMFHFSSFQDWFQIGILITMLLQLPAVGNIIYKTMMSEKELEKMKNELTKSRTALMLSQIQPHFIFNSLGTIKRLYDINHKDAKETLERFTKYLRENIQYLNSSDLIPFEEEIEHLENYIYLEQVRFKERVKIKYEFNYNDFCLPVLTLQPIVENAIRHGITERREGGTVCISTRKKDKNIQITIEDDGVGFAIKEIMTDGKEHVGLSNVKSRIEMMCHGTLEVTSEIGKGTIVEIEIPDKR